MFCLLYALPILLNVSFISSRAISVHFFFCKAIFLMDPSLHFFQTNLTVELRASLCTFIGSGFAVVFCFLFVFILWFKWYSVFTYGQGPSSNLIIWCLTHSSRGRCLQIFPVIVFYDETADNPYFVLIWCSIQRLCTFAQIWIFNFDYILSF